MPLNRLTFFYEQGENGWSESIHTSATGLSGLQLAAQHYRDARLPLLNSAASMTHVRASDDLVFRDVFFDLFSLPRPGLFAKTFPPEAPWTAIKFRLGAGNLVQRTLFLRGLPSGMISDTRLTPTGTFLNALDSFRATIVNHEFGIKNKDRSILKQPIGSIDATGNVVMTIPLSGVSLTSTLQILGIPRSVVPKREYSLSAFVDQSHFTLRGWNSGVISNRGFIRPDVKVILQIDSFQFTDATERRVGRPFAQQRGRRAVIR